MNRICSLLWFSPFYPEPADEVTPVALETSFGMFYATTAKGFKWLDTFFAALNPNPRYDVKFLEKVSVGLNGKEKCSSYEVANKVQRERTGKALGFECKC